jgi:hypothetical protein
MGSNTVHLLEICLPLTFEKVLERIKAIQSDEQLGSRRLLEETHDDSLRKYRLPPMSSLRTGWIEGFRVEREQHHIQVTDDPSFFGARKECYINMYARAVLVVHVTLE